MDMTLDSLWQRGSRKPEAVSPQLLPGSSLSPAFERTHDTSGIKPGLRLPRCHSSSSGFQLIFDLFLSTLVLTLWNLFRIPDIISRTCSWHMLVECV
jgi:hypothetical protein